MATEIRTRAPALIDPADLIRYRWATPLPMPLARPVTAAPIDLFIGRKKRHLFAKAPAAASLGPMRPPLPPLRGDVWGYGLTRGSIRYPGPLFVAKKGTAATINVTNRLPDDYPFAQAPVDLGRAMEGRYSIGHAVVHLHGAELDWTSDGYPARIPHGTENPANTATVMKRGQKHTYTYPNTQRGGGFLWYHDHAMDMTARNVYAGLAGGYVLRAGIEEAEFARAGLDLSTSEIPLVLQDRSFTAEGQLFYGDAAFLRAKAVEEEAAMRLASPADRRGTLRALYANAPSPEFKGEALLVNGAVWPYLKLEPRAYRFRMLNGANSRMFALRLSHERPETAAALRFIHEGAVHSTTPQAPVFHQIGSDGALLKAAVPIDDTGGLKLLILAPGERADIVVDFSAFAGKTLYLTNHATNAAPTGNGGDSALAGAFTTPESGLTQLHPFGSVLRIEVGKGKPAPLDLTKLNTALAAIAATQNEPEEPAMPEARSPDDAGKIISYLVREDSITLPVLASESGVPSPPGPIGWKAITFRPLTGGVLTADDIKEPGLLWSRQIAPPHIAGAPMGGPFRDKSVDGPHPSGAAALLELWEFYNISPDVHPMHLHLVNFQVLERHKIKRGTFQLGAAVAVDANEQGWKDTVRINPYEQLRLLVRFKPAYGGTLASPANFVWHCHILEHEDMGMMRPLFVA
jgi:spore coat protein A, manganese oxidase